MEYTDMISKKLWDLCKKGDLQGVKDLLSHWPNIDQDLKYGQEGTTPLIEAAKVKSTAIVKLLLSYGAKVNEVDNMNKESALYTACVGGDCDTASVLLDKGANVNHRTDAGKMCCIAAASLKSADILKLLIQYNVDVNQANNPGNTALHWASLYNNPEIVEILMSSGASADVKNKKGETSLDLASKNNNTEVIKILTSFSEAKKGQTSQGQDQKVGSVSEKSNIVRSVSTPEYSKMAKTKAPNSCSKSHPLIHVSSSFPSYDNRTPESTAILDECDGKLHCLPEIRQHTVCHNRRPTSEPVSSAEMNKLRDKFDLLKDKVGKRNDKRYHEEIYTRLSGIEKDLQQQLFSGHADHDALQQLIQKMEKLTRQVSVTVIEKEKEQLKECSNPDPRAQIIRDNLHSRYACIVTQCDILGDPEPHIARLYACKVLSDRDKQDLEGIIVPYKKTKLLIDKLLNMPAGNWTNHFVESLKQVGATKNLAYELCSKSVPNSFEDHQEAEKVKKNIRSHYVDFYQNILADPHIDELYSQNKITEGEKQEIEAQTTYNLKAKMLLDKLLYKRASFWVNSFVESLLKDPGSEHFVEKLLPYPKCSQRTIFS